MEIKSTGLPDVSMPAHDQGYAGQGCVMHGTGCLRRTTETQDYRLIQNRWKKKLHP